MNHIIYEFGLFNLRDLTQDKPLCEDSRVYGLSYRGLRVLMPRACGRRACAEERADLRALLHEAIDRVYSACCVVRNLIVYYLLHPASRLSLIRLRRACESLKPRLKLENLEI